VWGFIPQDGGSPICVETHGKVPRITEIFDDSGSSIILSIMGFLTRLKIMEVNISEEKMEQMIIKEKLSKRAVVKENGLGQVYLQERRVTPKGT